LFRLVESQVIGYDQLGIVKQRQGNRLAEDSPRNTYRTNDGRWIGISASSQRTFERLAEAIGMPELIDDSRFVNNVQRCANADVLDQMVSDWFARHSEAEVMELFARKNVVAGPVLDIGDIFRDPHYAAREDIVSVADRDFGQVRMQNVAPRLSATPGRVRHPGGGLGQDNEAVFCGQLGLDAAQLARLKALKVI
jgi:crotonobetainyl-CoA:carnitine CoA-transferase CaiB-like acyl-CoA transferase